MKNLSLSFHRFPLISFFLLAFGRLVYTRDGNALCTTSKFPASERLCEVQTSHWTSGSKLECRLKYQNKKFISWRPARSIHIKSTSTSPCATKFPSKLKSRTSSITHTGSVERNTDFGWAAIATQTFKWLWLKGISQSWFSVREFSWFHLSLAVMKALMQMRWLCWFISFLEF